MENTDRPGRASSPARGRWKWYLLAVIGLVFVLAWIDGGEEAIHPIVQNVAIPEGQ